MAEPLRWRRRRSVLDLLEKLSLARPAVRLYEDALAARSKLTGRQPRDAGGLPLPPARLRARVGPAHADADFFLRSGEHHAALIGRLLAENDSSMDELDAVLDFGCGCGRIMRHWSGLPRTRVFGCDIDPRMVEWCNAHLPFAEASINDLSPPLPYKNATFDLVYALSVFTHLPEELQHSWMHECSRVLKPGGYLLISTLGEYYVSLKRLTETERRSFFAGNLVVLYEGSAGTSLCSAYHPPEYVRRRLGGDEFELVVFLPASDDARHDLHLFRKAAGDAGR